MQAGKRIRTRHLDVRGLASPLGHVRVGVVVPRHGQTAVRRNRLKRQLRELSRLALIPLPQSCDVLIRARPEAYAATFTSLQEDVATVVPQLERLT